MDERLLKELLKVAPRMEPTDAVKLAFQSAFGCGHLLADRAAVAGRIRAELARVNEEPTQPAATVIGGGLCRLNLAAPAVRALSPEHLADLMLVTARHAPEGRAAFEADLAQLRALATQGATPFSLAELDAYLAAYRAQGCPPVSHSERYRAAYAPAYRVVLEDFATLLPVLAVIDARLACEGHVLVVLDGPCGSGKTTLAGLLGEVYGAVPLHMDDFFLPFDLRTPERLAQAGGNIHHERFSAEVLEGLLRGGDVPYQRFDCQTDALLARLHKQSAVTLIEGSYSHHPAFDAAYAQLNALRVLLHVAPEEQLRRLAARDPERLSRFQSLWIPLEKNYIQAYDIKGRAHIVLNSHPRGGIGEDDA